MDAAERGHVDIVRLLKRVEARMVGESGESALMLAAAEGHLDVVQELLPLEEGIESAERQTALLAACEGGHVACVRYIVENSEKEMTHKYCGAGISVVHRLCQKNLSVPLNLLLRQYRR